MMHLHDASFRPKKTYSNPNDILECIIWGILALTGVVFWVILMGVVVVAWWWPFGNTLHSSVYST